MLLFLNPFVTNIPTLYPLETPKNKRFSGFFRGYKMTTLATNGLRLAAAKKLYCCGKALLKIEYLRQTALLQYVTAKSCYKKYILLQGNSS